VFVMRNVATPPRLSDVFNRPTCDAFLSSGNKNGSLVLRYVRLMRILFARTFSLRRPRPIVFL
jgi:hypothetical protein